VNREFATFYEHEAPRLVRSVTLAIGDATLAEDAVAEAFARAWSRWAQVRRHDRPIAWVMRVAINESRSRFRRRAVERRRGHEVALPEVVHDPDISSGPALWEAVRGLGERERTLIALRYVADLSQPEIAELLGIPPGTVASGLHRARQQLERSLAPIPQEDWQ
jgi:RNA polymerase sigma-70 factor (ECF subfamily)